jgi:hypothetical protein
MKIENKELSALMHKDAQSFAKLVKEANNYATSVEDLDALVFNPTNYASDMLPTAAHQLELPVQKLFELYNTPIAQIRALASSLEGNEYYQFITDKKGVLELDSEQVDEYIKSNAVHELTGNKEKIYKAIEKVVDDLNKLQSELKEQGSAYPLNRTFAIQYDGFYKLQKNFILTIGR